MATWGTRTFEDDTAVDWISELVEADETREFLLSAITLPENDDDVDYDTAVIAIAGCEVIVALLDEPRKGLPEQLKDWLSDNECDDITDLPETASVALQKVLSGDSELVTTWQEAEDYDDWKDGVDELQEIIEQLVDA